MKFDYSGFFETLKQKGIAINDEQSKRITEKISTVLSYEPKVGILGKTGVGKSSLCNALFGQEIAAISDIEACTRNPQEIMVGIGSKGINLVDVPGVGESYERDQEYTQLYTNLLPELDVVLWLLKSDDRAYEPDQRFYKEIVKPHLDQGKPFFIVLNQVDMIKPHRKWDEKNHKPGSEQLENIKRKLSSVSDFFSLPPEQIIAVSAEEQYNLAFLIEKIIFALPKEKKITFAAKVNEENVSVSSRKEAEKGFWDTVWQFITEDVPAAAIFIADCIGDVVDGVNKIAKVFFSWF